MLSVLSQSVGDWKLIVLDNASEDDTKKIMQKFSREDKRIQYIRHGKNIGMMHNYAFGFGLVRSKFFSLLSDDDFLLPWYLNSALAVFRSYPQIGFCACSTLVFDNNNHVIADPMLSWTREGYINSPDALRQMAANFLLPPGILFNSVKLRNISPDLRPDIQARWDSDFLLRATMEAPIYILSKPCAMYMTHPGGFGTAFFTAGLSADGGCAKYSRAWEVIEENLKDKMAQKKLAELDVLQVIHHKKIIEINHFCNIFLVTGQWSALHDYLGLLAKMKALSNLQKLQLCLLRYGSKINFFRMTAYRGVKLLNFMRKSIHKLKLNFGRRYPPNEPWEVTARLDPRYAEVFAWLSNPDVQKIYQLKAVL